jgi:tetratricopeptide (TPR) repeat protein
MQHIHTIVKQRGPQDGTRGRNFTASRGSLLVALAVSLLLPLTGSAQQRVDEARMARLFDADQYGTIRNEMNSRLRSSPEDAAALYWLGRAALSQDQFAEAVRLLERSVAADPRQASAHAWLGTALGMSARNAGRMRQLSLARQSRETYERALAIDPRNVYAREGLAQFYSIVPGIAGGSAAKARQQAAELSRVSRLRGHISLGLIAERAKDHAAAEREFRSAVSVAPDSAISHLALGHYYARMKRWGDAYAAYERLLERNPGSQQALYHIGRVGALSGERLERAQEALTRWLSKPPDDPLSIQKARTRLAEIQSKRGRLAATP